MKITLTLCAVFASCALTAHIGAAPGKSTAPPYSVRGTIATNRLGDAQSAFLRTATHICGSAASGPEQELAPGLAAALANVLLDDRTWVGEPGSYDTRTRYQPNKPTVNFTLSQDSRPGTFPRIEISIDPLSRQMHTMAWGFNVAHGYEQSTSYALAAPQMTALLKQAFPQDAQIQALPVNPSAAPMAEDPIPPAVRAQIAALHTGMTRADLLKLFKTEGGLSNRFQRSYIYGGETKAGAVFVPGHGLVKINAEFMPRAAHLKWIEGAGTLIDPEELYRFDGLSEQPDDVIVRLSKPYLGMEVSD